MGITLSDDHLGMFPIPLSRSDVRLAQPKSEECSTQELEEFFGCVWMSRI